MARSPDSPIRQVLRRSVADPVLRCCPDRELLRRFREDRDEAAFVALVRRHGPMVFDTCRAALPNEADAEDAFQATFLVLAGRADSVRDAASLASWLHGVARRTACRAKTAFARRGKHEARLRAPAASESADDLTWREVRQVVHEELAALPERYRVPLVLCYLQGQTQDRAAALAGVAESTLKERLERGRALLRARLVRRGLGPAALVASAWPVAAASAGVPPALVSGTVRAATGVTAGGATAVVASPAVAELTEGVVRAMSPSKAKVATGVLLTGLLVGSVGLGVRAAVADREAPRPAAATDDKPAGGKDRPAGKAGETVLLVARPVKAVDARKRTLTVAVGFNNLKVAGFPPGGLPDETFELAADALVEIDGKPGKLADLPVGAAVTLRVPTDRKSVRSIRTDVTQTSGRVTAVDAAKGEVTIDVARKGVPWTLPAAKGALVEIDGKPAPLADLPVGSDVTLILGADGKTVCGGYQGGPLAHVTADIRGVDAAASTLTIATEDGERSVSLAKDAKVVIAGKDGALTDVPIGAEVELRMTAPGNVVVKLAVRDPRTAKA